MKRVTVTGSATPRSSRPTWIVRVDGRTVYGGFDRAEANRIADEHARRETPRAHRIVVRETKS